MAKPTDLQSPENDYESLLDVVWKEEERARLDDRLEAELNKDESRARRQAKKPQSSQSKSTRKPPSRTRVRTRSDRVRPRLRDEKRGEGEKPGNPPRASLKGGVITTHTAITTALIVGIAAMTLAMLGAIFQLIASGFKAVVPGA